MPADEIGAICQAGPAGEKTLMQQPWQRRSHRVRSGTPRGGRKLHDIYRVRYHCAFFRGALSRARARAPLRARKKGSVRALAPSGRLRGSAGPAVRPVGAAPTGETTLGKARRVAGGVHEDHPAPARYLRPSR